MAILRTDDIKKLGTTERQQKLTDLKIELTKANNKGSQAKGKRKELKRAIARLLTFNNSTKGGLKKE